MAGLVLKWTFGFQINISAKLKVSASKSATSPSCKTLHTIYFPNCRRTLRSYFFARKLMKFINEKSCVIMENWNQTLWKTFKDNSQPKKFRKTETKLCGNLQRQFSDFSNLKTIFSPKLCGKLKTEPNFVDKCCVEFFSSWKYNTVCNIGLFQVARLVITQNDVV